MWYKHQYKPHIKKQNKTQNLNYLPIIKLSNQFNFIFTVHYSIYRKRKLLKTTEMAYWLIDLLVSTQYMFKFLSLRGQE